MTFQTEITLSKPPSEVFRFVSHPGNMKKWVHGFSEFRRGKGPPRAEGSTGVQVFKEPDGQITEVQEEVLKREKNQLLSLRLRHRNMESRVRYHFLDQGGATLLRVNVRTRLRPLIFNLIAPFVKGPMKRQQKADLQRLRDVLEK